MTVSLEIAKKLKEAGWPQERPYFWWVEAEESFGPHVESESTLDLEMDTFGSRPNEIAAAPTAFEIAEKLPSQFTPGQFSTKRLQINRLGVAGEDHLIWEAGYPFAKVWQRADSFADALALLWLALEERRVSE